MDNTSEKENLVSKLKGMLNLTWKDNGKEVKEKIKLK